mgnify:FL=1
MNLVALKELDEGLEYLSFLHSNNKGFITRAEMKEGYKQWHYKYKELILQDLKSENVYISLNTFYSTYRRLEFLKELNCLFIDLDYYKTGFNKEQILMDLEENYFNKSIPTPNRIIDSGRGLYLIWKIETVPSQALPLWKAIEEYLYKVLKTFGADRQALDPTRVLRVVGSVNSKSKSEVKVLDEYNYIYTLREIQSEFLPDLEERKAKTKGRKKKVRYIHDERNLYLARIHDITKLCELRDYDLKGHRELILFLYRYYLCYFLEDTEKALNDTLELNSMFRLPLASNEVKRATRSAETVFLSKNKDYRYKNTTLINLLEISESEERFMTTIISNKEYKRRENIRVKKAYQEKLKVEGKLTEKEKLSQRRAKIKDLLAEGLKQKDICLQLDISKPTYIRDRNYLKEQGLI